MWKVMSKNMQILNNGVSFFPNKNVQVPKAEQSP